MIESLDQLQEWVIELFSDIRNKELPVPAFEGSPLTSNELLVSVFHTNKILMANWCRNNIMSNL